VPGLLLPDLLPDETCFQQRIDYMTTMLTETFAVLAFGMMATAAMAEDKRIMVFGDSNSWGGVPQETIVPTTRYDAAIRWPGVMDAALGDGYVVIEESLSARTAATDDPSLGLGGAGLNGLEYLPAALATHMPLDLVIIMLGTNDVKPGFGQSPLDISLDILQLASEVQKSSGVATSYAPAKVLIVAPPPLGQIADVDWLQAMFPDDSIRKSNELAGVLGPLAQAAGFAFLDAATVARIDGVDGVHMSADQHAAIGAAVAASVKPMLAE
jgi:lysophospholipase L1-like esterase